VQVLSSSVSFCKEKGCGVIASIDKVGDIIAILGTVSVTTAAVVVVCFFITSLNAIEDDVRTIATYINKLEKREKGLK
jgi:hypothetical protein